MIPFVIGLVAGLVANKWWVVVFPIAFAVVVVSTVNYVSVLAASFVGVIGVAIGIFGRRRFDARREGRGADS